MVAISVMLQGTGSDVGKSLLTAGLCRALARRGLNVRPFKPQNMSNNAAVTEDGGEIGRAQALQARAARVPPSVDMNPVLLKPQGESGAQIVVQGRVLGNATAREYQSLRSTLLPRVLESYARLGSEADLVLIEGAGSAAEVNLRQGDIANMGFAEAAQVPVVLVGDIERGGVIAQLVGTYALLTEVERAHLIGFVVNKFRGDASLFDDGVAEIARRTGLECFGVVPWFEDAVRLPAEDSLALDRYAQNRYAQTGPRAIKIAVLCYPRIANFDDLDPLRGEPDVEILLLRAGAPVPGDADLVVLPGSKATLADLASLRACGWDVDLQAHVRRGGAVLGLCGGYQMLGRSLADPDGIEGVPGTASGLGLLEVATRLAGEKRLVAAEGCEIASGHGVRGYEMHMGVTTGPGTMRPMLDLAGAADGAISSDGRVMGCYLHGLFASDPFRQSFLDRLKRRASSGVAYEAGIEATLDELAAHCEAHLDIDGLLAAARAFRLRPPASPPSGAKLWRIG
jgi:adenosylcobyric acid synthase